MQVGRRCSFPFKSRVICYESTARDITNHMNSKVIDNQESSLFVFIVCEINKDTFGGLEGVKVPVKGKGLWVSMICPSNPQVIRKLRNMNHKTVTR